MYKLTFIFFFESILNFNSKILIDKYEKLIFPQKLLVLISYYLYILIVKLSKLVILDYYAQKILVGFPRMFVLI